MLGFALLLGHMIGDYIWQNDFQAKYKAKPWPGRRPQWSDGAPDPSNLPAFRAFLEERNARAEAEDWDNWPTRRREWWIGHLACTVHCTLYALAVLLVTCMYYLMPWWFYVAVGILHWPQDRFGLARKWMNYSGQKVFATGALSPWSIIVVDNTFHLIVLYTLALLAGVR